MKISTRVTKNISAFSTVSLLLFHAVSAWAEVQTPPPAEQKSSIITAKAADGKPEPGKDGEAQPSPDTPMANINGTVITQGEVARSIKAVLAQNRPGQTLSPAVMKQAEEVTLENLIAAELLYQAGKKLEINDLDKQVEARISQGKARFPSPADFEKALKSNDLTEKELTEYTKKDLVISNLINKELAPKVTVSDEEAKKFYDQNADRFSKPESVKASHILVGVDPKAGEEEKRKAKEKAGDLLKKIRGGADFAAIAKTESTCPSSAQGGDLGSFGKGQMVAPFEKAAFAMKPGDLSDVVETEFGYHIIKVTEKHGAEVTKFEDSRDKIKEYLKGQKMQGVVKDYVAELRSKSKIEKPAK